MGDRGINMNKRCDMVEAIDRIYHIVPNGSWPAAVFHFLKRPAALDFMADYMAETGKPLGESVLILLAAMRYIDNSQVAESGLPSILEEPMALTNLDLFLVRHHAELFHLCRSRHVQANLFERAFPVMEMLAERYPDQEVVKSGSITRDDLEEQMEKNRISLNNRLPKYMQVTAVELVAQEFEKTPKKSIKRYLYK